MKSFLILAAPLLIFATPASAQDVGAAAQAAPAAAPAAKEKKVCRSAFVTGRRIAQRKCYLASQWAEYDRVQEEAAKKMIHDVVSASGKSNLKGDASGSLDTLAVFGFGPAQSPTP